MIKCSRLGRNLTYINIITSSEILWCVAGNPFELPIKIREIVETTGVANLIKLSDVL